MIRYFYGGILIIFSFLYILPLIEAQEKDTPKVREEIINIDVREKSFAEVIEGIREQTGKNIIYDDDIRDIYVTIRLIQVPWRKALEVIAKQYNCKVEDLGDGVIKVSKPPTVTMEFEGADIRDIINQIATIANKNIVVSEQVKGAVSLRLKNVPWEDALESIVKTKGYVVIKEKDGKILRIVPPEEMEAQLETKIIKLKYIRPKSTYVAQMKSDYFKLDKSATKKVGGFTLLGALESVLTPNRGKITYDDNTNTLIITDVKPKIDKMMEIIKQLDKEPKQVFIDIKFIRSTNTDLFDFGIDVNDNGIRISQSFGSMVTRFPFTLGSAGWEDKIAVVPTKGGGFPSEDDYNISPSTVTPITFGQLDFSETSFMLRLLKKDTKSKIIQAPKIITLDHHEATIFVGRSISFARTQLIQNDNGTTSVEITEAENSPAREGFQILIVPHVIPDTNKIQLTVIPSNDQLTGTTSPIPGFNRFEAGADSKIDLPEITQQVVVTHMILESNQTAVLGGLLKIIQSETVRKIPFLGDIPIIGYFFKFKSVNKQKEDMFIFITPKIIQSAEDTQENMKAKIKDEIKKEMNNFETIWQENLEENKTKK